jgi:acetolactate synthase-1/2/3 large subunit
MPELVADRVARLLQREGAEAIVGFPENRLLNSAALLGMRPIITRTERVAVNIADGFARVTNGERFVPCVTQYGPGAEAAFAAVAQAYGDRSPILLLPGEHAVAVQGPGPELRNEQAYAPITRFAATVNDAARGPAVFRRALNALHGPRNGPVLVTVANDVLNGPAGDADWDVKTSLPRLTQASADDVTHTTTALLAAARPVILAGQGVLYAGATAELVRLAELTGAPVATTLNGKSAFPEHHPLALGTAGRTRPATVDHFLARADLVLGIGTSFTRSLYITPMPAGTTLGQITDDRRDLASGYDVAFGCVGDARLVLLQLLAAIGAAPGERRAATEAEVAEVRAAFMEQWRAHLTSDASPLSPYRVVWELMHVVDRTRTVVTHDAGHPRDQVVPFYRRACRAATSAGASRPSSAPVSGSRWAPASRGRTGWRSTSWETRPSAWSAWTSRRRCAAGSDPDDRAQQRADGRLHRMDAGRRRALRRRPPRRSLRRSPGRSAATPSRFSEPTSCARALERCIAAVATGRAALCEVATHEKPAMAGHA